MLSVLTFHMVSNPDILEKLQRELASVMPEPDSQPKWSELEQLPYLVRYPLHSAFCVGCFIRQIYDLTQS